MSALEKMKTALIRAEIARTGAADAELVEAILDSLSVVTDAGEIVSRDDGKPLTAMLDGMKKTNPHYFVAPTPDAPRVILDPYLQGRRSTSSSWTRGDSRSSPPGRRSARPGGAAR